MTAIARTGATRRDDAVSGLDWGAFRSARVFSINGTWYFATREGLDQGPFADRARLDAALTQYVEDRRDDWHGLDTG